jgi:hypothetical protein
VFQNIFHKKYFTENKNIFFANLFFPLKILSNLFFKKSITIFFY